MKIVSHFQVKYLLDKYLKGTFSFISGLFVIFILFIIGFISAPIFEFINIKVESLNEISGNILSAYIGVLGIALAISAIILSIIQIVNNKINIAELIFRNSYFAPTFYFGLINISILAYVHLFVPQGKIFNSQFIIVRIVVIEVYLFVIFSLLIVLVFFKVFKYLNFSVITDEYIEEVLSLVEGEEISKIGKKETQKISQKGKEMIFEITDCVSKGDEILAEKFLNCFYKCVQIKFCFKTIIWDRY